MTIPFSHRVWRHSSCWRFRGSGGGDEMMGRRRLPTSSKQNGCQCQITASDGRETQQTIQRRLTNSRKQRPVSYVPYILCGGRYNRSLAVTERPPTHTGPLCHCWLSGNIQFTCCVAIMHVMSEWASPFNLATLHHSPTTTSAILLFTP